MDGVHTTRETEAAAATEDHIIRVNNEARVSLVQIVNIVYN